MSPAPSFLERVLIVVGSAVLVAGVVSAVAIGREPGSTRVGNAAGAGSGSATLTPVAATPSTASPTTTTRTGSPTTIAGSTSTTAGKPASPTTTSAPPPPLPTVAGSGDPGQPTPTAPGTYLYDISSSSAQNGSTSGTLTEKVVTASRAGATTRQSVDVTAPKASGDSGPPNQGDTHQEVEWNPQGGFQVATTFNAGGQSGHCVWNPPILEMPSGLAPGRQWSFAGTCNVTFFGRPATIHLTGHGSVTGRQQVRVGADVVPVWVASVSYTAVVNIPSFAVTVTLQHTATDRVSGRLGLIIEEDATDTFTIGARTSTTTSHQALKSIHPS